MIILSPFQLLPSHRGQRNSAMCFDCLNSLSHLFTEQFESHSTINLIPVQFMVSKMYIWRWHFPKAHNTFQCYALPVRIPKPGPFCPSSLLLATAVLKLSSLQLLGLHCLPLSRWDSSFTRISWSINSLIIYLHLAPEKEHIYHTLLCLHGT